MGLTAGGLLQNLLLAQLLQRDWLFKVKEMSLDLVLVAFLTRSHQRVWRVAKYSDNATKLATVLFSS